MTSPRYMPGDRVKRPAPVVGYQRLTVLGVGPLGLDVLSDGGNVFRIPRRQCDPRTLRVVARPARITVPSLNS